VTHLGAFLGFVVTLSLTVIVFTHGWDLLKELVSDSDR